MSPSAIVLNVSAAIFLALFLSFVSYLLVRYRKVRQLELSAREAKEIHLFNKQVETVVQQQVKYKFAEVD